MQLPNGPGSCFAKRLLITLSPLAAGVGWGAVQACRLGKGICGGHSPGSTGAVTQVRSPVPSAGAPNIAHFTDPLVEATIMVYSTITSQLLPTPERVRS